MRRGTLALIVGLALGAAPSARGADEEPLPDPVRTLEVASEDALDEARAAFPKDAEGDALVVSWLRDDARRARLSPRTLTALAVLAAERGLKGANAGLRALVRDEAQPREVRAAAITALATTGTLADVSALGDAVPAFPEAASRALAAIGGDTARAALRRNESGEAPLDVAAALVRMSDDAPLARLVAALRDPATSPRAAELLRWATGADLPAESAAWETWVRRRTLAKRFADPDAGAAQAAVEEVVATLRGASGDAAADDLCAVLADERAHVFARAKAALALGLGGRSDRMSDLLAATPSGVPGEVRRAAVDALARVGDLSCAVPLARGLALDTDLDRLAAKRAVRQEFTPVDPAVVRTLLRLGVRGGVEGAWGALLEVLEGDYRTGLHRDAMRAFAEVSAGELFGYQPDAAKPDRLAAVARMRAWWREARETIPVAAREDHPGRAAFERDLEPLIHELGELKFLTSWRARMALAVLAEPAHDRLVAALSDRDVQIRMGAAQVLGTAGLRRSAVPLARRLADEPNAAARTRLLTAIESCGRPLREGVVLADGKPSPQWVPTIREAVRNALADRNLDVRAAAAGALGVVGDAEEDRERLVAARAEPRNAAPAFRSASAGALLRLGDRSGLVDLAADLRSDDVAVRAEALRLVRAAGRDVPGYDPDASPEARDAAAAAWLAAEAVPAGGRR